MKERKKIDDLFNEKLNHLEAAPGPHVWENILSELQKDRKKRRVVPLWLRLGGVAALLALLLTVGNFVFNSNSHVPAITTDMDLDSQGAEQNRSAEPQNNLPTTPLASEDTKVKVKDASVDADATTHGTTTSRENKAPGEGLADSSVERQNGVAASTVSAKEKIQVASEKSKIKSVDQLVSEKNKGERVVSAKVKGEKVTDGKGRSRELPQTQKEQIWNNEREIIAKNATSEKEASERANQEEKTPEKQMAPKKSIFDAIAETQEEENLQQQKTKQKPERRWNVAPNVAPVYYSSLGNGSSIDPSFADNPQKGDVNMSYGIQVSYALSNRLSVRTGLNSVALGYSTSGIEVGTGPVAVALRSVDYGGKEMVVTAVDKGTFAIAGPDSDFGDIMPKSTQGDARIIQDINYYEVPVELKYALVNRRLGVNVIGGLSTLFLGNNEISVKADNFTYVLGEANNLSSVSFSTNVGLGLDYKLSKKFTFNIEPMFKYQLNPYSDSSVNFKPYYLGVYSGLSFKF